MGKEYIRENSQKILADRVRQYFEAHNTAHPEKMVDVEIDHELKRPVSFVKFKPAAAYPEQDREKDMTHHSNNINAILAEMIKTHWAGYNIDSQAAPI